MRYFEIVDGRQPKRAIPCGMLSYNEDSRRFSIEINRACGTEEVPMLFIPFMERDEWEIPPEWALVWVRERICPPNRQNIAEVLEANGIDEYDELTLLLAGDGRCSQDEFMVREARLARDATPSHFEYAFVRMEPAEEVALKQEFGMLVASTRKGMGQSQPWLGMRACIPQSKISQIERGEANPTLETVAALAHALGKQPHIVFE